MTIQEAIDILKGCDPDAILTDWDGDEISGFDDNGETVEIYVD